MKANKLARIRSSQTANHLLVDRDAEDRTLAGACLQPSYIDDWRQAESIKMEFHALANRIARLGTIGRKTDVIDLMAWEIVDLRRAIGQGASNREEEQLR